MNFMFHTYVLDVPKLLEELKFFDSKVGVRDIKPIYI